MPCAGCGEWITGEWIEWTTSPNNIFPPTNVKHVSSYRISPCGNTEVAWFFCRACDEANELAIRQSLIAAQARRRRELAIKHGLIQEGDPPLRFTRGGNPWHEGLGICLCGLCNGASSDDLYPTPTAEEEASQTSGEANDSGSSERGDDQTAVQVIRPGHRWLIVTRSPSQNSDATVQVPH